MITIDNNTDPFEMGHHLLEDDPDVVISASSAVDPVHGGNDQAELLSTQAAFDATRCNVVTTPGPDPLPNDAERPGA